MAALVWSLLQPAAAAAAALADRLAPVGPAGLLLRRCRFQKLDSSISMV